MKLEMLLCAKSRRTDGRTRRFSRSQLLWFYPAASGQTRNAREREAENAYGSINALIWPPFRLVPYSFRSGSKKASRPSKFASKLLLIFLPHSDGSLRNG